MSFVIIPSIRVSVDGDQSTSDSVVAISSNKVKGMSWSMFGSHIYSLLILFSHTHTHLGDAASVQEFLQHLSPLLTSLAEDLVRNGEGVQHVMRVRVKGVKSEKLATSIGKSYTPYTIHYTLYIIHHTPYTLHQAKAS
ncbi:hypothetical protein EON63_14925 [archaeon]|nr:MAG: hypothetical protein EON63_14925 [archaeon]